MTYQPIRVRLDPSPEILADRLSAVDTSCVMATVVAASGSTYSKPGARMLIEANGRITGLLSGGCFEQDLREHSTGVLSTGIPRMVTYDMRGDNDLIFGIGAGCEGSMDIFLEPVPARNRAASALAEACELARRRNPIALATIYDGPTELKGTYLWYAGAKFACGEEFAVLCEEIVKTARAQTSRWVASDHAFSAWIQPLLPLPAVLICGAGPDAVPVAAALRALYFPVVVHDHRPANAAGVGFSGADIRIGSAATIAARVDMSQFFAAVVMSHNLASDADYLRALADTTIEYIGLLGPRARRERLLADIGGAASKLGGRLVGPVGLDIGAVTPEGIALAIAAEIHKTAAAHGAGHFNSVESVVNGEGRARASAIATRG